MSTHKHIAAVCVAAILLCIVLTVLFMNGEALGLRRADSVPGYQTTLFDTSRVHTIDIVMDGWDSFIETCENEEYHDCAVVIDGESCKNVALRAKGNTSLSSVSSMGSQRYSFKIEFDHYDSGKSYRGLDKLCLNNLIQDNTLMKDYLVYQLMAQFGVPSPLCSYVWVTVNGQDWGLYLAVESVEDSFLRRNYGSEAGQLYKPDSQSFGGGRGNGRDFRMEDWDGQMPDDLPSALPQDGAVPDFPAGGDPPQAPAGGFGGGFGGRGFGGGMGSADVMLQYIDDDPASYPNIFDNAKTDPSDADKARLIASLKDLSHCKDLEDVLDIDAVLRYFAVHSFVVNGDSYTGAMIHNYYLYEQDGRLSMIPWDYNLAFGGFQGGSAASAVNDPIDDVLTGRPMQSWIFSDPAYIQRYHALYAELLQSADTDALISQTAALIAPYVQKDPTGFCSEAEFEAGVSALKTFCALRAQSVAGQLDGSIPSTTEGQKVDPLSLVDAAGLDLSDMGSMGGMGGGPGGGDIPQGFGPGSNGDTPQGGFGPGGNGDAPQDGFAPGGNGDTPQGGFGPGSNGDAPQGGFGPGSNGDAPQGGFGPGGNGDVPQGGFAPGGPGDLPAEPPGDASAFAAQPPSMPMGGMQPPDGEALSQPPTDQAPDPTAGDMPGGGMPAPADESTGGDAPQRRPGDRSIPSGPSAEKPQSDRSFPAPAGNPGTAIPFLAISLAVLALGILLVCRY